MRIHVGKVPPNDDFHPERDGWQRMQEPSESAFFAQASAVGILAAVAVNFWFGSLPAPEGGGARIVVAPGDLTAFNITLVVGTLIGSLALLIILHELLHLLFHPRQGRSRDSIVGVLLTRCVFYAFYDAEMTRNRFIAMVAAPFVLISLLPTIVFTFTGQPPVWIALAVLANALFSGGDLVVIALVVRQLPRNALIRHHSWDAYWKAVDEE